MDALTTLRLPYFCGVDSSSSDTNAVCCKDMLIAFDLDRTIVTENFVLPIEIEQTIKRVREAGHVITVITGRARVSAEEFLKQLNVTEYYSVNHGALVMGKDELVLRHSRIKPHEADAIIKPYIDTPDLEFSFFEGDVFYVRNPDDPRWAWAQTQHRLMERYQPNLGLHADKIVFSANGQMGEMRKKILEQFPNFVTYLWADGYLEITGVEADKGAALKLLAETLGFAQDETIAFGDGPNDVTMIQWAGRGIAVGPHAYHEVLDAAAEHIAPPEELGVAKWLEKNLL
jgi:5-amino-6-(5-phospho-D-ribitylamino)uracil phosphatase